MTKTDADLIALLKIRSRPQKCRNAFNYGEDQCDATYDDDGNLVGLYCGEPCNFIMHGDQEVTLLASEVRRLITLAEKNS